MKLTIEISASPVLGGMYESKVVITEDSDSGVVVRSPQFNELSNTKEDALAFAKARAYKTMQEDYEQGVEFKIIERD
jgi:hypothetical protein